LSQTSELSVLCADMALVLLRLLTVDITGLISYIVDDIPDKTLLKTVCLFFHILY